MALSAAAPSWARRKRSGRVWTDPVARLRQTAAQRKGWRCEKKPTKAQQRRYDEPFHFPQVTVPPTGIGLGGSWADATAFYSTTTVYWPSSLTVNDGNWIDNTTMTVHATAPPWQYVTAGTGIWGSNQTVVYPPQWMQEAALYGHEMVGIGEYAAPITPEEADRRLRETRARAAKFAIERQRAVRKGRRLLLITLSEIQQRDYAATGSFLVQAANGKWYRCRKNGTTHELGIDGQATHSHCIHLSHSFIPEDTLIAVKLLLETDPAEFHRIANTTPLRPTPRATTPGGAILAAAQYGQYARELEQQVVAEETGGLVLPLNAQQVYVAQALGHDETIGGVAVAA